MRNYLTHSLIALVLVPVNDATVDAISALILRFSVCGSFLWLLCILKFFSAAPARRNRIGERTDSLQGSVLDKNSPVS